MSFIVFGPEALMLSLTENEKQRLQAGLFIARGRAIYCVCRRCRTLVRANKWLMGSTHLCTPESEGG